jgi:hypothetical protein
VPIITKSTELMLDRQQAARFSPNHVEIALRCEANLV